MPAYSLPPTVAGRARAPGAGHERASGSSGGRAGSVETHRFNGRPVVTAAPPAGQPAAGAAVSPGLAERAAVLAAALAAWAARDDTRPQPETRRAASNAMSQIDAMLRELHQLRARLTAEIRASDDGAAERADALLARPRKEAR